MGSSTSVLETTDILITGSTEWISQLLPALEEVGVPPIETRSTIEATLEEVTKQTVDCIITGYDLTDGTGVELVEAIRDITTTLPVIVCTDTGTEAIASDAIGAGATDYIALSNETPPSEEEIADRIALAVRDAQRTETLRDRAQQFDAIFQDTQTATWVLDPDGTLQRANGTARDLVDADITDLTGDPFWTLPWWTQTPETQSDIRQVVQNKTYVDAETVADIVDNEGVLLRHNEIESRMFFVATVEDEVVGWVHIKHPELEKLTHTAELTLGVLEEHRGRGIGGHLLERGLEWAGSRGYEKIYNSVPASNDDAISFLEAHGWEIEATREDHYKLGDDYVDEVMMDVRL
jgi:ribosomal protein S18 acetylase RimI-like enzyme/ActR/RegA family two-component response regulator